MVQFEDSSRYYELVQHLTSTRDTPFPSNDTIIDQRAVDFLYKNLDKKRLKIIYKLYEMDFKVFGYTKYGEPGFPDIKANKKQFI